MSWLFGSSRTFSTASCRCSSFSVQFLGSLKRFWSRKIRFGPSKSKDSNTIVFPHATTVTVGNKKQRLRNNEAHAIFASWEPRAALLSIACCEIRASVARACSRLGRGIKEREPRDSLRLCSTVLAGFNTTLHIAFKSDCWDSFIHSERRANVSNTHTCPRSIEKSQQESNRYDKYPPARFRRILREVNEIQKTN